MASQSLADLQLAKLSQSDELAGITLDTNTPLGASATFTSPNFTAPEGAVSVIFNILSDQTTAGVALKYSLDGGATWNNMTTVTVTASIPTQFKSYVTPGMLFRFVFTNSATPQTTFLVTHWYSGDV